MNRTLIGALLVLVLVAAACGGGSDEATTTTPPDPGSAPTTDASTATTVTTGGAIASTTSPPEGAVFLGADGVETRITDTSRIVSLNGDITEILYALGLGAQVVAVDVTTTYPADSEELPRIGFGQDLAPEPVLAFSPTLVIGDQMVGPSASLEQLRAAGIPVAIIPTQVTIEGAATKIRDVAEIVGLQEAGDMLASEVTDEIQEIQTLVAGIETPISAAFLYSRGPGQIFLFGQGNVSEAMINAAGAVDVIAASGVPGVLPLTPEALIAAAPDVLILPESGVDALGGLDAVLALPGVAETPAGQNGRLLVYDDALFLNLGPRTGEALAQLVTDLYPDLGN